MGYGREAYGRIRGTLSRPKYLVRLARSLHHFTLIVNEARCTSPPWPEDLVDRVIDNLLEGGHSKISVYLADTASPLDCGYGGDRRLYLPGLLSG